MLDETFNLSQAGRVYLDHNATTPLNSELRDKISQWLSAWGNPSSIHNFGRGPKTIIRNARKNISELIGCQPQEIVFTSGGSEANNYALKGLCAKLEGSPRNKIVVSAVEHPSVLKTAEYLQKKGFRLELVKVSRDGHINLEDYEKLVDEETALVSIMFANNETGSIFPVRELCEIAHSKGALFHCDAVQALGKTLVDVKSWGVDTASFSAHKFYSLKGCGLLYVKSGTDIENLIHGGAQERSRRAGTENTLAIACFGEMAKKKHLIEVMEQKMSALRDYLQSEICKKISHVTVNGVSAPRLCNSLSLVIEAVDGESLLMNLDLKGFAVSTGAACSSGNPEPSPVLISIGLSKSEAQSSLRIGIGWETEQEDLDKFINCLVEVVGRLRRMSKGLDYGLS